MTRAESKPTRRRFIASGAAIAAAGVAAPGYLRAQAAPIKLGVLQPLTGALAFDGQQGQLGADAAIEAVNEAGGIKSLGGAKLVAVGGDARSTPDGGTAEVERMQNDGVVAIVGGFASPICLAATQAAARYDLPYIVDVGVTDQIVQRGLKNTFRFAPGFGTVSSTAVDNLVKLNDAAGKPAKTVVLVHEDGLFGSGLAKLLQAELPKRGFEILDTISHPTPARDMSNVALQIKAKSPDLLIPSDYYGEFVLLARTMQQQRIRPKGIYSVLNGGGVELPLRQGIPRSRAVHHGLQSLVRSAQGGRGGPAQEGRGAREVLHLQHGAELFLRAAGRRCARAGGVDRPRQAHGSARLIHLRRAHHALRADQVRQRAESRRGARQSAGAGQRHQSYLPGGLRRREAGLPRAGLREEAAMRARQAG